MLAGIWLAYSCFGLISGAMPPLIGSMSEEFSLSRSAMGTILAAWPLVFIATSLPAGALLDRFGLRSCVSVGIILISLSGLLRAVATGYATLFMAVAIFGLGAPFISIGAPKLISVWFDQRDRGTAMGIYMTAPPVGRIIALATANSLLMPLYGLSWRLTLGTYAGVAILVALIWWLLARDVRQSTETALDPHAYAASGLRVLPSLLRIRVVQIILILSTGSFLFRHGLNDWLPEILRSGGMTASEAGYWAALPIVVGIGATLTIPYMAKGSRRTPILVGTFLASGVAVLCLTTSSSALLILGLLILGTAGRAAAPIIMLTLMDARQIGTQHIGSASGLYFAAGEVGGVLGPVLLAVVADLTGGFLGGMLMLTGLSFALAALTIGLRVALRNGSG
ncbi:MAG: MFS transporter [Chloroflexi bacterium]|nr:MFS transporter [Chloroflexota bacterium]